MYVCMLIAVWQPPLLCSVSTAIQAALCLSCRKKHNKHDAAGPSSCYLLLCSLVLQIREMLLCRVYGPLAQILSISVSENWDLPQDRTLQMGISLAI